MMYAIYKNGRKYAVVESKERAESIKRAVIAKENEKQNRNNLFINLVVEIREIRQCCDCAHYQECFFADSTTSICNSYKDAPKVIDSFCELPRVAFTAI